MEFKRKLTTILSADAVGYSRLMTDNEEETVRTLKLYRSVIESLITKYTGRLVDSPGDNLLAEFSSVVDSLRCAWDIQNEIKSRNLHLPENRRMTFRIGINLGDVIEEDGRIYGDGVNVAARLEGLADAGGITISGTVHNHIENKVPFRFENQGEQSVKNIDKPIHVYRLIMESETSEKEPIEHKIEPEEFKLPEGPSIAVLPFTNMSGDSSQEYICDGLTENIITSLSYNPKLFVIARNSSFYFKAKSVPVQEVAEKLNVRYVLEGSFQKAGERIRITTQLIDANTGHHIWAEKYDRDFKDFFELQDDISEKIFVALRAKLTDGEGAIIYSKYSTNFEAELKLMKAVNYVNRANAENNILARREAEHVLSISPKHPSAYIVLGWTYIWGIFFEVNKPVLNLLAKASKMAKLAMDINNKLPDPYMILGFVYLQNEHYEKAIELSKHAILLSPNYSNTYYNLGITLMYADMPKDGLELMKKAIQLDPLPPSFHFWQIGNAYRMLGNYQEAVKVYKKAINIEPDDIYAHLNLTATYFLKGEHENAYEEVNEVLRIDPNFLLNMVIERWPFKNKNEKEKLIDALRKAGLK